jgi:hypothetical protein
MIDPPVTRDVTRYVGQDRTRTGQATKREATFENRSQADTDIGRSRIVGVPDGLCPECAEPQGSRGRSQSSKCKSFHASSTAATQDAGREYCSECNDFIGRENVNAGRTICPRCEKT